VTTRVYVPSTSSRLHDLLVSGGLGPVPVLAHALTDEVRGALPELGEEELEYAALTTAAQDSLGLLTDEDRPQRVVVVAEASSTLPVGGAESSLVEVDEVIPLAKVVAVHIDSEDAGEDVAAARDAYAAAGDGDEGAVALVERCLDHELGWFATQELALLAQGRQGG
jgi:hypothetical protein